MLKTIFLDEKVEVLIVSSGGVGTTFLMEAIGKYKLTNCSSNTDGFKHMPIPPLSKNKKLKVVYVFGDPIMSSVSLFRRQYHHTQSVVMQKYYQQEYIIPFETSLDQYAANRVDGFFFLRHLENWLDTYPTYPTIFIRYETLYESLEALSVFLDLPGSFISNFPEKKKRKSSVENISLETLHGLQAIYYTYTERIKDMPNFWLNAVKYPDISYLRYLSFPYRNALLDTFLRKNTFLRKIIYKINQISFLKSDKVKGS